jgi:acyl-CoA synthetase (AMP-forming)/AMP-acid ligase II
LPSSHLHAAPSAASALPDPRPGPDEIAFLQLTSGSTGRQRAVMIAHRGAVHNPIAIEDAVSAPHGRPAREWNRGVVSWLPLYHDMGLMGAFLLPLLSGCPTVLIPTMDFMRDPSAWLRAIHAYRGSLSWAPNFAYGLCATRIADADLVGLDLSSWRIAITAAEPVLAATVAAFCARLAGESASNPRTWRHNNRFGVKRCAVSRATSGLNRWPNFRHSAACSACNAGAPTPREFTAIPFTPTYRYGCCTRACPSSTFPPVPTSHS